MDPLDPEGPQFLLSCLRQSLANACSDLLDDITEICTLNSITAKQLAGDEFSVASAAKQLYLTTSEAAKLMDVCRKEVAHASNPDAGADAGADTAAGVGAFGTVYLELAGPNNPQEGQLVGQLEAVSVPAYLPAVVAATKEWAAVKASPAPAAEQPPASQSPEARAAPPLIPTTPSKPAAPTSALTTPSKPALPIPTPAMLSKHTPSTFTMPSKPAPPTPAMALKPAPQTAAPTAPPKPARVLQPFPSTSARTAAWAAASDLKGPSPVPAPTSRGTSAPVSRRASREPSAAAAAAAATATTTAAAVTRAAATAAARAVVAPPPVKPPPVAPSAGDDDASAAPAAPTYAAVTVSAPWVPRYLRGTCASKERVLAKAAQDLKPEAPSSVAPIGRHKSVGGSTAPSAPPPPPSYAFQLLMSPTSASLLRVAASKKSFSLPPASDEPQAPSTPARRHTTEATSGDSSLQAGGGGRSSTRLWTAPFRLVTDARTRREQAPSSEDRLLLQSQSASFKSRVVPRHVHEARPLEFRAASNPKLPQEVFVPFELRGAERRAVSKEEERLKAEAQTAAEEAARSFRATKWSKDQVGVATPRTPTRPEARAVTEAVAFTFCSEGRAAHHAAVVTPLKKAKEAELASPKKLEVVVAPFEAMDPKVRAAGKEEARLRAVAEAEAEEAARGFRAMKWSKDQAGVLSPTTPPRPAPRATTAAVAFSFCSDGRAAHHAAVTAPLKKAKEAEMDRDKLEEQRRERELEEAEVATFRKTLQFKASRLPDFAMAPFRPNAALAAPVTTPCAFVLRTSGRLGDSRIPSMREAGRVNP